MANVINFILAVISQRRVSGDMDVIFPAVLYQIVLWQKWMGFDLIDSWYDSGRRNEFLENWYRKIGNANSSDFVLRTKVN